MKNSKQDYLGIEIEKKRREQLYIFNPEYNWRKDFNRIILYKKDYYNRSEEIESAISFVHPLFAMLLLMFDGKTKTNDIASKFAILTSQNLTAVNKIINKLLIKNQAYSTNFDSIPSVIPKNILVPVSGHSAGEAPKLADILIPRDMLDHQSLRLDNPLDLIFEINFNCVTDCIYCYADRSKKYKPLESGRILELIQEARQLSMRRFSISGGEVFLHKDWPMILQSLIDHGFSPFISTKVPIGKEDMIKLKDIGVHSIQISLDTIIENEMKQILNVDHTYYKKILRCLDDLSSFGFKVNIKSQITRYNENSVEQLLKYLLKYQNIERIKIGATSFSIYKNTDSFLPSEKGIKKINEIIETYKNNTSIVNIEPSGYASFEDTHKSSSIRMERFPKRVLCSGNLYFMVVLPDGKVTICEELYWHPKFIIGDLAIQTIEEVWKSPRALELYHFSKSEIRPQSICKTCPDDEFTDCHERHGVCWKEILRSYGYNNWDYPDPGCPKAPFPLQKCWLE